MFVHDRNNMSEHLIDDEKVVEKEGNYVLTDNRIIYAKSERGKEVYQDLKLDKITGFAFEEIVNKNIVGMGIALSIMSVSMILMSANVAFIPELTGLYVTFFFGGFLFVVLPFIVKKKEYKIHAYNQEMQIDTDSPKWLLRRIEEERTK